ncbi:MAG: S1 RNA-binding domain-containing protein [Bacilli bacterium]|nr:S1 RNA-binding domain-containing protein [Bacilli bacterium]
MSYQIGEDIIGTVINIKPYAVFLKFDEKTQGLLHISEISDSYIRDIEKYASIDDQLKVRVISIDPKDGFLRVSFKQIPENERFSTHDKNNRVMPKSNLEEFKVLEEKLDGWIEETLSRKENKND